MCDSVLAVSFMHLSELLETLKSPHSLAKDFQQGKVRFTGFCQLIPEEVLLSAGTIHFSCWLKF